MMSDNGCVATENRKSLKESFFTRYLFKRLSFVLATNLYVGSGDEVLWLCVYLNTAVFFFIIQAILALLFLRKNRVQSWDI